MAPGHSRKIWKAYATGGAEFLTMLADAPLILQIVAASLGVENFTFQSYV